MDEYQRYAIYYLPEPGPLAEFGATWLGWDVFEGTRRDHPTVEDPALDIEALTQTPRKYGFHGTIKPPFYLADGHSAIGLYEEMAQLASKLAPVTLDGLELASLGSFLALKPVGDQAALADLAARVVKELDAFRAPPSEAELARRKTKPLSPAQEANLDAWGYPYVMEEFRFHMTLSGAIKDAALKANAMNALSPLVTPIAPRPFHVSSLCLTGSDEDGRFHLIDRFALTGG